MKRLIVLILVIVLTGCGKAPFDECASYADHTLKDYGQPKRMIQFAQKGDFIGGYVYYYPDAGFVKTFDTVVPEDTSKRPYCQEAWVITDKDKFISHCQRFDCTGVVLDQLGPLPF